MMMGNKIAAARRAKGLSQENLAEKLGVSFQAVSTWERDESMPDTSRLKPLADELGLSVDSLLSDREHGWERRSRLFSEERTYTYLKASFQAAGMEQALAALAFAREKHQGQFRKVKTGEKIPYIIHPLTLCGHAWAMGLRDEDLLSALLLHDVVEDTGTKPEDLPVSDRAREAVKLVSYNSYYDPKNGPEAKRRILPEYYARILESPMACLIKCIDRCNNLSTMASGFPPEKMAEYVLSTEEHILPMLDVIKAVPEYNSAAWLLRYQITALLETFKWLL